MDFNVNLPGFVVFTKLDIVRAFYTNNIRVLESDIEKTDIITPFELFEFPALPFGLHNSTQT